MCSSDLDVIGEGAYELSDAGSNMVVESYLRTCAEWGVPPRGLALECHNVIPLCRGLGSSSTAIVAGVVLADAVSGYRSFRAIALDAADASHRRCYHSLQIRRHK